MMRSLASYSLFHHYLRFVSSLSLLSPLSLSLSLLVSLSLLSFLLSLPSSELVLDPTALRNSS